MKARPVLFSGPMVRALLDGRKTQTRRIVKNADKLPPRPEEFQHNGWAFFREHNGGTFTWPFRCPYGEPGDLLWVRETFIPKIDPSEATDGIGRAWYMADSEWKHQLKWKPSIFMPRWASRMTLELTEVRVERLQDISEADAIAEGAFCDHAGASEQFTHAADYRSIWESINGPGSWNSNPWVWCISFRVHHQNVDALLAAPSEP